MFDVLISLLFIVGFVVLIVLRFIRGSVGTDLSDQLKNNSKMTQQFLAIKNTGRGINLYTVSLAEEDILEYPQVLQSSVRLARNLDRCSFAILIIGIISALFKVLY